MKKQNNLIFKCLFILIIFLLPVSGISTLYASNSTAPSAAVTLQSTGCSAPCYNDLQAAITAAGSSGSVEVIDGVIVSAATISGQTLNIFSNTGGSLLLFDFVNSSLLTINNTSDVTINNVTLTNISGGSKTAN